MSSKACPSLGFVLAVRAIHIHRYTRKDRERHEVVSKTNNFRFSFPVKNMEIINKYPLHEMIIPTTGYTFISLQKNDHRGFIIFSRYGQTP